MCRPDKGKRAVIGIVYPSGLGAGPGSVLAREFSGWGAVFGMEGAGQGKLSLFEQRLCKLSHASTFLPPWQR